MVPPDVDESAPRTEPNAGRRLHAMTLAWAARLLALATFVVAGCSCAMSHEQDSSQSADATVGADGGEPTEDAWVCNPTSPTFLNGGCTAEADVACQAWAQTLAPSGTIAASRCDGNVFTCTRGADCEIDPMHFLCTCSGTLLCRQDEVCISDTPGGPTRCVPICSGT